MDYFNYKNNTLTAEGVEIKKIVAEVETPVYIYSKATFLDHLNRMRSAFSQLDTMICYSVKACGNVNILRFMAQADSGFDIVSGGELFRALQAGADPSKILYAGVGKTDNEIIEALEAAVGYFNVESEAELDNLIRLAKQRGIKTKAALRVNPDVRMKTHAHITTGVKESKFGVDIDRAIKFFSDYHGNGHVDLCAIHLHLGSGGKTIDPYCTAIEKILLLVDILRSEGHRVEALDIGGGYGADYESDTSPSAIDYASGIVPLLKDKDLKLILEPGKSICANAGILVTKLLYEKVGGKKTFAIVDGGMNDLIRPALYDAFHFIWPVDVKNEFVPHRRKINLKMPGTQKYDVVGPICEGADFFAKDRLLPPVKRGDLLAIFTAGAYGFTMSSNYNARPRVPEVLVDGEDFHVIRQRETYQDMIRLEK